jgi:hypothetical protein
MKPCACGCRRMVDFDAPIPGWCASCAQAVLLDVRKLQNLAPADLVVVASLAHDAGATRLAKAIVGALPFDGTPYEGMLQ